MRKKRRGIIQLSCILFATIIALLLCFVPIKIVGTNYTYEGFAANIKLGTDLKGGVFAVYQVSEDESRINLDERLNSTVLRLSTMIQNKGYPESVVKREGAERIRVEVPDVADPATLFSIIGTPASMQFTIYEDAEHKVVKKVLDMTGKNIVDAAVNYQNGEYGVSLDFDKIATSEFDDVTRENIGKVMGISVNFNDGNGWQPVTYATLNSHIKNGQTFISGNFTPVTAEKLAQQILAGAFDVRLSLKESSVMSASLGVDALMYSMIAGIIAVVAIIIFLCVIYRGMGLVSGIALLIYVALFIFLLFSFPWVQLSLPGIAGIILSLGMAVDANVIIFERIREEYRSGKSVTSSVKAGFKRSLWTVLDANITSILASVVLIILGSGTVRGFGITLLMGILLSLLTAMLVSRGLFKVLLNINKTNAKFYGLTRDETVKEIADEPDKKKERSEDPSALPLNIAMEREKMYDNAQTGGKDV